MPTEIPLEQKIRENKLFDDELAIALYEEKYKTQIDNVLNDFIKKSQYFRIEQEWDATIRDIDELTLNLREELKKYFNLKKERFEGIHRGFDIEKVKEENRKEFEKKVLPSYRKVRKKILLTGMEEYHSALFDLFAIISFSADRYESMDRGGSTLLHSSMVARTGSIILKKYDKKSKYHRWLRRLYCAAISHDLIENQTARITKYFSQKRTASSEEEKHLEEFLEKTGIGEKIANYTVNDMKVENYPAALYFPGFQKSLNNWVLEFYKNQILKEIGDDKRKREAINFIFESVSKVTRPQRFDYEKATEHMSKGEKRAVETAFATRNLDLIVNNKTMEQYERGRKLKNIMKAVKVINEQRKYIKGRRQAPTLDIMIDTLNPNIAANYEIIDKEIQSIEVEVNSGKLNGGWKEYTNKLHKKIDEYTAKGGFLKITEENKDKEFDGIINTLRTLINQKPEEEKSIDRFYENVNADDKRYYKIMVSMKRLMKHYMLKESFKLEGL